MECNKSSRGELIREQMIVITPDDLVYAHLRKCMHHLDGAHKQHIELVYAALFAHMALMTMLTATIPPDLARKIPKNEDNNSPLIENVRSKYFRNLIEYAHVMKKKGCLVSIDAHSR